MTTKTEHTSYTEKNGHMTIYHLKYTIYTLGSLDFKKISDRV